ncbi:MAG: RNA polymerase sigma-70 factor (ECF subfamily) [Bacteroidia bacterium]
MSKASKQDDGAKESAPLRDMTISGGKLSPAELFSLVYEELHGLARRTMAGQGPGHTLQPTALVNEVYLRLAGRAGSTWHNREHFLRTAAQSMRHILVDHARRKSTTKRQVTGERVALDEILVQFDERSMDILALDEGLLALAVQDPKLVQIVEMHFFGGCTFDQIAVAMETSPRGIQRDWQFARSWLHMRLKEKGA